MNNNTTYINAKALLNLYHLSNKKHLIITGSIGSGKTTLINKLSALIYNKEYNNTICTTSHIISKKVHENVVISSPLINNAKSAIIGHLQKEKLQTTVTNKMQPIDNGFFEVAIPAINKFLTNKSNETYFFIDELGYLETRCIEFQNAIFTLLDNTKTIAVIRKQHTEFLDSITSREDVLVVDIDTCLSNIACIIMASGASRRFGTNKLLAHIPNTNITLIENAINISNYIPFSQTVTTTIHKEVANICEKNHISCALHNLPYRNDSIRIGMENITSDVNGIMFLPADKPLISSQSMQLLCMTFNYYKDKICRLAYKDTPGSPVIFPMKYEQALKHLPQKCGGGYIIKQNPTQVILVPATKKEELLDIDTPQDYTNLFTH